MRMYNTIIMSGIIITCIGMDKDSTDKDSHDEYKTIESFVKKINENQKQEKLYIPFLLSIEKAYPEVYEVYPELVTCFAQRLPSSKEKPTPQLPSKLQNN